MLMAACNPIGFHVLTALPRGLKANAGYYATKALERIKNWRKGQEAGATQKLLFHIDDARPDIAKSPLDIMDANRITRAPHPPNSPD
jgi:hypothetical protein